MPNCQNCRHKRYCKLKDLLKSTDNNLYLNFCPLEHISNYKHFRKKEREYILQIERQQQTQLTDFIKKNSN